MIAQRRIVNVTEPRMVLDLGSDYEAFRGHTVEIIVIFAEEDRLEAGDTTTIADHRGAFEKLSGAMRNSVKWMSDDFDEADDGGDWEAAQ